MLIQLQPEQMAYYWSLFSKDIDDDPPPIADYGPFDVNNILTSIMTDRMQAWLLKEKGEGDVVGFVLTTILYDVSGVTTLLIYNTFIYEKSSLALWKEALQTLIKFGRHKGCAKIASFVMNKDVIEQAELLGAETRFVYINYNI